MENGKKYRKFGYFAYAIGALLTVLALLHFLLTAKILVVVFVTIMCFFELFIYKIQTWRQGFKYTLVNFGKLFLAMAATLVVYAIGIFAVIAYQHLSGH